MDEYTPDTELVQLPEDGAAQSEQKLSGMICVVDIRFRNNAKTYFFDPDGLQLSAGDHVIIDSNNPYITIEPKTFSEPGQQKITITLLEESHLSCDFTVNVKEKEEPLPSETPASSEAPKEEPAENTPAAPTAEPAEKAESTASPVLWYVIGALILIILILIVCIIILQKQNAERIELMRKKRRRARRIAEEQRRYSDNNDEL